MRLSILLLGVLCGSLSAVFVRWSTAPSLVLALYRMAFSVVLVAYCAWPAVGRWGCISPLFFKR